VALLTSIGSSIQQPPPVALAGWEWAQFLSSFDSFGSLLTRARYSLEFQKVSYPSLGANGQPRTLSGLLILPRALLGSRPAVPILLYQHGTEPYRAYAPSRYLENLSRPADYPEVMIAAAIASSGYAVAMADYEGLGDSTAPQPYVHGASLARQVIDMLRASRDIIATAASPCSWNSQLFLLGYSEGGYVTLTTTRELQRNHAAEFTVTAAAPLAGPHDLSGVMRGIMLANSPYKAPYFLPFFLTGYHYAYGAQTTDFSAPFAMTTHYAATLPPLFDGNYPSNIISAAMGMSFNPALLIAPPSILTQPFINQLADVTSPVVGFLRENDSYRGWTPTVPIRMFHHRDDDLVPYTNSRAAFTAFSSVGAKRVVSLVQETITIPASASSDPAKSIHLSAAIPLIFNGWKWLDGYRR
jgi:predicted esterase